VSRKEPDYHFDCFRSFFGDAGYHFPETREEAERYCAQTDELLAAEEFAPLWDNVLHAGVALQVEVGVESIARFLLPKSAARFGEWQRKRPSCNEAEGPVV
jgi:hypothetical protein